ncbi:hypothetical protein EIN_226120 [Entamoeba invadens IP1]|uniref:Uncharacterized protein n=1 Tax=Entamoeba invadens IP1 TaxID=370355 RepID=A0A0A1U2I9_ENTIV|nr:hypothetical protein EIN_226120 [Entamoeba invadens IP1]ELP88249.1 hypothetical protein EIN_226120 [Entamoeba invadens IP1]|eukprot:XP_004255020.1 hypothetical protein EIN_226120 [Entamoeba invadens IP1]
MEAEIQLAHFKKVHYAIIITMALLFVLFSIFIGIFGPDQYNKTIEGPYDMGNGLVQYKVRNLKKETASMKMIYTEDITTDFGIGALRNINKEHKLRVSLYEEGYNETHEYKFKCVYSGSTRCGELVIFDQQVYKKQSDMDIAVVIPDFNGSQVNYTVNGSLIILTSNPTYDQANIMYSLVLFLISIVIFALYVLIELRFVHKKGTYTSFQFVIGLLVFVVVGHSFPWNGVAYTIEWVGIFAVSKAFYAMFNVVFFCFLFFVDDSFTKQNGQEISKMAWIFRGVLLSLFMIIRITNSVLHIVVIEEAVLIPTTLPYVASFYFDIIEELFYFFLYSWALYILAMTYNFVTVPVVQKQLSYFAGCTGAFIMSQLFMLFFSSFFSQNTSISTYFQSGSMLIYLIALLSAFLPSLSPVKNEWSIFYNEMEPDNMKFDEDI